MYGGLLSILVLDHLRRHYSRSERERPAFVDFPRSFRLDFIDSTECRTYYGKIILYETALAVTCQFDRHMISAKNSLTLSALLGSVKYLSSAGRINHQRCSRIPESTGKCLIQNGQIFENLSDIYDTVLRFYTYTHPSVQGSGIPHHILPLPTARPLFRVR